MPPLVLLPVTDVMPPVVVTVAAPPSPLMVPPAEVTAPVSEPLVSDATGQRHRVDRLGKAAEIEDACGVDRRRVAALNAFATPPLKVPLIVVRQYKC